MYSLIHFSVTLEKDPRGVFYPECESHLRQRSVGHRLYKTKPIVSCYDDFQGFQGDFVAFWDNPLGRQGGVIKDVSIQNNTDACVRGIHLRPSGRSRVSSQHSTRAIVAISRTLSHLIVSLPSVRSTLTS